MHRNRKYLLLFILLTLSCLPVAAQFEAIDQKARELNIRGMTTKKLSAEINQEASSPLEKVRFLYVFVAHNISYDVSAFFKGKSSATEPNDVLKAQKAVCQGYANLFHEVCSLLGIRSQVVSGFSKGYGFNGKIDPKSNHAWIAVFFDDRWHLLDPTWGAGYLNQSQKFIARFEPKYFLTNPAELVTKHLPEDPAFQLLECPIDVKTFLKDSTSILATAQKCDQGKYKFRDTLQIDFSESDSLRILRQARRIANFAEFGSYNASVMLLNLAFKNSAGLNDKTTTYEQRLNNAEALLQLYQESLQFAKKSKTPESKELKTMIYNNINNIDSFIQQLKKIMQQ
jgi:hypothetical protein